MDPVITIVDARERIVGLGKIADASDANLLSFVKSSGTIWDRPLAYTSPGMKFRDDPRNGYPCSQSFRPTRPTENDNKVFTIMNGRREKKTDDQDRVS